MDGGAGYGLVLGLMNLCFYLALDRLPLGIAVTVEFLGPLAVALIGSRRWLDALWAVLAGGGVVLLMGGGGEVNLVGLLFALGAGACWGLYIVVSAALGRHTTEGNGLALGMIVAALVAVPFGVADSGAALVQPWVLVAGLGVALLSSVVPYSLDLEALRKMPPRVFGILMSLEPAMAALIGFVLLGRRCTGRSGWPCCAWWPHRRAPRAEPAHNLARRPRDRGRQCALIRASSARVRRAASVSSRYRSSWPPRTQALRPSGVTTLWPPWPARR